MTWQVISRSCRPLLVYTPNHILVVLLRSSLQSVHCMECVSANLGNYRVGPGPGFPSSFCCLKAELIE